MLSSEHIFENLRVAGALAARLAAISARKQLESVAVGLQVAGERIFAAAGQAGRSCTQEASQARVRAGCLAKPLTATLAAEAVAAGQFGWETEINDILGIRGPVRRRLARVTFSQLLNHTHGLDGSEIAQTPLTPTGWVDTMALCRQLAARPLSAPGSLYSYSDTGTRLAAAALERLSGKRYSELLVASDLIGGDCTWEPPSVPACPATGNGLELTISHWLRFLHSHMQPVIPATELARSVGELRAATVPVPGWSAGERGSAYGWKDYGGGWFGHNANMSDCSALLRFNPREAIGIVLAASGDAAFFTLAGLVGTALPEFASLQPPRMLSAQECCVLPLEQYPGIYAQSRMALEITMQPENKLCLTVHLRGSAGEPSTMLRPAQHHVFFPDFTDHPELPFVQFVRSPGSDRFDYLWNGRQLWRRS